MIEISGWLIIPMMPLLGLIASTLAKIPSALPRKLLKLTWLILSLAIPLIFTTGSTGGDYSLAIVVLCYALKLAELFFCEPFASTIQSLPTLPFLVLLMTYQDQRQFEEWYIAWSDGVSEKSKKVIAEGRIRGLKLWLRGVAYWAILNCVMAVLPGSPSHVFENWPRDSWQFWAYTFLSGVGAYLVLALTYSWLMGFYALIWGIHIKEMFNYPFLSVSLREWWSQRWNLCYKDQYYRIVFQGLYGQALNVSPKGKKTYAMIAALATFLFSGVVHEYLAYCAFGKIITWENTAFFVLHGLYTSLEVLILPRNMNRWVQRFLTFSLILFTAPLFQGPYQRNDFYVLFKIPYLPGTKHSLAKYITPNIQ